MKKDVLNTDAFWSAVKRKSMGEILAAAFTGVGEDGAATIATDTTRMTDAAIVRMRAALSGKVAEDEGSTTEDPPADPTDVDYADKDADTLTVADIKLLLESGKKKNIKAAKKAFKEQFAKEHPNYKELKKLIKQAKAL